MDTTIAHTRPDDYERIAQAIRYMEEHFRSQPNLDAIAAAVHLSKYHFDRLFTRWAGISPKRFLRHITLEYTKKRLAETRSLQEASLDAGLSGTGRLHDLFVSFEAVTPGEYKRKGAGVAVTYGFHPSPFGECLLAVTDRGICHLGFVDEDDRAGAVEDLRHRLPMAELHRSDDAVGTIVGRIFSREWTRETLFPLHLRGTNFQVNVWKALLNIPEGAVISYADLAASMGRPEATRAVASAVAANPVGFLIPCHRVITGSGAIHRYRWGTTRKKALIGWEAALSEDRSCS